MKNFLLRLKVIFFMFIFISVSIISTSVLLIIFLVVALLGLFSEKPIWWFQNLLNKISMIKIQKNGEVRETQES